MRSKKTETQKQDDKIYLFIYLFIHSNKHLLNIYHKGKVLSGLRQICNERLSKVISCFSVINSV